MFNVIKGNSAVSQRIKEKFVDREVYACVSGMVEYILQKSYEDRDAPFSWDDAENFYLPTCRECGSTDISEFEKDDSTFYKCNGCGEITDEEPETEPQKVYEWWIVSGWLADKLRQYNEVIIDDGFNQIWGRCTTGQAILLDGVITDICEEMEILEGQKNQWDV